MAPKHIWTDEDAAFAAAQWASGVTQRDIGRMFKNANESTVCLWISRFIEKYHDDCPKTPWNSLNVYGNDRKRLVKQALASFVAARGGQA
jgi:hypothetical protein